MALLSVSFPRVVGTFVLSLTLTKKPREYGVNFEVGQVIPEIDRLSFGDRRGRFKGR